MIEKLLGIKPEWLIYAAFILLIVAGALNYLLETAELFKKIGKQDEREKSQKM